MNFDSGNGAFLGNQFSRADDGPKALFVDAVGGSDGNDGSLRNPFETISRAILEAKNISGENSISIAPGYYNEILEIDDFGGLDIFGAGGSPGDVFVNASGAGSTLKIDGGSSINIENMMFANGLNGIFAEHVDHLSIRDVRSRNNSGYGLLADDINTLDINFSNFLENGAAGARVMNSGAVDIGQSFFSVNAGHGISVEQNQSVLLRQNNSSDNGLVEDDESPRAAPPMSGGIGLQALGNEYFEVRAGYFLRNENDGVSLERNQDAALYGIQAADNRKDGIGGESNWSVDIRGGAFARNQGSGVDLIGFGETVTSFTARGVIENEEVPLLRVIGGRYLQNWEDGVRAEYFNRVELSGMFIRESQRDGIHVEHANTVWMNGISTAFNGHDGADLEWVDDITANHIYSAYNGSNGLEVESGASMLSLTGGNYFYNGENGLDFAGSYRRRLHAVDVLGTVAMHNQLSGMTLYDANEVTVKSANVSRNGEQGFDLYNVGQFSTEFVHSRGNGSNGLLSNTGTDGGNGDNGGEPVTMKGGLNFKQSYFTDNGEHGFLISSIGVIEDDYQNDGGLAGPTTYNFDVLFDRVTARGNNASGVYFGRERDYEVKDLLPSDEPVYGYGWSNHINLDVNFERGNYSDNGTDGVRAESNSLFSDAEVYATIRTYRTTANRNAGNGMLVDASNSNVELQMSAEKSAFIGNGLDGISVWTSTSHGFEHSEPYLDDEGEQHVADFYGKQLVAHANGGHGLNLHVQESGPVIWDVKDPVVPTEDDHVATPTVAIDQGSYNNNALSGINMNFVTQGLRPRQAVSENGGLGSLIVLDRAVAVRNGENGLGIFAQAPSVEDDAESHEVAVEINHGVYNLNGVDGISLVNLGLVVLDSPQGIANDDDGFEGTNLSKVVGDGVFVANGDQDYVLNFI